MEIRTLRADEIQVRVQSVRPSGKNFKGIYLLYKDARCDMAILDEVVGCMNWKKEYKRDNANCVVSIWDEKKQQWISKEDTGTESNTEAEKGLASDSFKRACFNWGIGRELYTAPVVEVYSSNENDLKYLKLNVASIQYDNKVITQLVLTDEDGKIRFDYDKKVEDAKKVVGKQYFDKSTITPKEQKSTPTSQETSKMSNEELIKMIDYSKNELAVKYKIDLTGKNFIGKLQEKGITETNTDLLDNAQLTKYFEVLNGFVNSCRNAKGTNRN